MHVFPNPFRGLQHRKGPKRRSQGSAQLQLSLTLPRSVCSALFHLLLHTFLPHLFFPVPFHCGFSKSIILHPLLCFSSLSLSLLLLVNVDDIDFPTTELQLSQDYRLQGEREALHSQRTQIYPTCSAVMPGNQAKFLFFRTPSLLKEGAQPMQRAHVAPNQQRRIFLIYFVVVEFCIVN